MNTNVQLTYMSTDAPLATFNELDCVRLRRDLESEEGRTVPAGSLGAVIAVWANGSAYEIEFVDPDHALVVAAAEDLERGTAQK